MNVFAEESSIPSWIRNTAKWWGEGQISDSDFISAMKYLIDSKILVIKQESQDDKWKKQADILWRENQDLKGDLEVLEREVRQLTKENRDLRTQNALYENYSEEVKKYLEQVESEYNQYAEKQVQEQSKPQTTITEQKINWRLSDSKGNQYYWEMPIETYENLIASRPAIEKLYFEMPSGDTVNVIDHTKFVGKSFSKVIDDVYDNSASDSDFIYEVWHIVSQLTTYSYDIGEYPRYALETLSRGGGDCEDTAILIADMLRSSKYTTNWKIQLVYFDAYNPSLPKEVNHVVVYIKTSKSSYMIESTSKTQEGMNQWVGKNIFGWWYDV